MPELPEQTDVRTEIPAVDNAIKPGTLRSKPAPPIKGPLRPSVATDLQRHARVARRDHLGRLGFYITGSDGQEILAPAPDPAKLAAAMAQGLIHQEDDSQRSMSPTQQNSDSVYQEADLHMQQVVHDDCPSTSTPVEDLPTPRNSELHVKHASARTESTALTYQEDNSRHIKLDFQTIEEGMEEVDQSQDDPYSYTAPQHEYEHASYEPKTPAPPANPLLPKGRVMNVQDMFTETPSQRSVGRQYLPNSSRPSPQLYGNIYTSPTKRPSSPLQPAQSPLQSSVRALLSSSQVIVRGSGVKSFDPNPRPQHTEFTYEPQPYISMQQSQERRRDTMLPSDPESDGSDSDIEPGVRQKRGTSRRIQRELSAVVVRASGSSRPTSSNSPRVEVPSTSTGRRRSIQDDYLAQCEGSDARDTQNTTQDDFIADSQSRPMPREAEVEKEGDAEPEDEEGPEVENVPEAELDKEVEPDKEAEVELEPDVVLGLEAEPEPEVEKEVDPKQWTHSAKERVKISVIEGTDRSGHHLSVAMKVATTEEAGSNNPGHRDTNRKDSKKVQPTPVVGTEVEELNDTQSNLPLQELSANRPMPLTPKKVHYSSMSETVPETSPPEQRLRPMGEIATISFHDEDASMQNLPGFSQDTEFENALQLGSSPKAPRARNYHTVMDTPALGALAVGIQRKTSTPLTRSQVSGPMTPDFTSSALSDPPPSAELQQEELKLQPGLAENVQSIQLETPVSATKARNESNQKENVRLDQEPRALIEAEVSRIDAVPTVVADSGFTGFEADTASNYLNSPGAAEVAISSSPPILPTKKRSAYSKKVKLPQISQAQPSSIAPRQSPRFSKSYSKKDKAGPSLNRVASSRSATPRSSPLRTELKVDNISSTTKRAKKSAPVAKRTALRRSGATLIDDEASETSSGPSTATRTSTRKLPASKVKDIQQRATKTSLIARESSEDPLSLSASLLFTSMAFAVSFAGDNEREKISKLIVDNGGQVLHDSFEGLFDRDHQDDLTLTPQARSLGFTALIADGHSRKPKYMQALALGLPCLSGSWINACVNKGRLVDWSPFLLCAGQSSLLGDAIRSRMLRPYSPETAQLEDIISNRDKLLSGMSILMITGKKGKTEEQRRAFTFLARALGPSRFAKAADIPAAKKVISEHEDSAWDLLLVANADEKAAQTMALSVGKKRKGEQDVEDQPRKKIRIVPDETLVQSLISGLLIDE